jgi:hypothetical protein
MADDPWAQFVQQPAADPWAKFAAPGAPAPAAAPASPSQGWGDYLLQHLAGAGQTVHNASRAVDDFLTFGGADLGQSYLPMPGQPNMAQPDRLALLRGQTQAAHAGLGTVPDAVLGAATYAMGPGELGLASKVGGAVAPAIGRWAGGVAGAGLEGAGASALGAAGHGDDVGSSALGGLLLGAAGGSLGGVVGRGGELPPAVSASDLKAQASQAYAPLSNILFNASEVHPEINGALANIAQIDRTGQQLKLAKSTNAEIGNLLARPQFTAEDIQKAQGRLGKIASSPNATDQDKWMAPIVNDALENVMQTGLPITGVPRNVQPSGYAASVRDAGDVLSGRAKDTAWLDDAQANAAVKGGPDVGSQARSRLLTDQGKAFNPPGTPQYDAMNTLAGTAQGPLGGNKGGLTLWDLKHHLLWPAIGLAGAQTAGAFGTAEGHQPWWASIPEDVAGIGAGFLLKNRLGAAGMAAQRRAADAARVALSTGQSQAPVLPNAPGRTALRNLIFGLGAGGAY